MTPSTSRTFLAFLSFLAQTLCFSAPARDPWQDLEIPSYPRSERLKPQTVGPGRPESASTASTLRRALMRNSEPSASGSLAHARALLAEGP